MGDVLFGLPHCACNEWWGSTWRRLWVCCTKEWRLRRPQTHCLSWKIGTTYLLCFDAKPNYSSLWFVDCLFLLLSSYPSLLLSPSLFDLGVKWSIFLIVFLVVFCCYWYYLYNKHLIPKINRCFEPQNVFNIWVYNKFWKSLCTSCDYRICVFKNNF